MPYILYEKIYGMGRRSELAVAPPVGPFAMISQTLHLLKLLKTPAGPLFLSLEDGSLAERAPRMYPSWRTLTVYLPSAVVWLVLLRL